MPRSTLTRKQAHFVELYLAGANAAKAYREAYSSAAPSQSVAREGHRLLKHPKIAPFLAEAEVRARAALVEAANRYAVSRERNVAELARMAYASMKDYPNDGGAPDNAAYFKRMLNSIKNHIEAVGKNLIETPRRRS